MTILRWNPVWDPDSLETGEKTGEEWGLRAGNRQGSHDASVLPCWDTYNHLKKKKIGETRGQDKRKKQRNLKILDFGNQWFFAKIGDRTQMLAKHLSLFVNTLRA